MGYTSYNCTLNLPLQISYRCSACSAHNDPTVYITEDCEVVLQGMLHRRSTDREMSAQAAQTAKARLERKLRRVLEEAEHKTYRTAEFRCCCAHCGHKEPWARMRYSRFEKLPIRIFLLGMVFSIGVLLMKEFIHAAVIAAVSATVLGGFYSIRGLHRAYMEHLIAELPPHALPTQICLKENIEDIHVKVSQKTFSGT